MAKAIPYLFFDGKCTEAMKFYQSCIGGELQLGLYGDVPGNKQPEAMKNRVMHSNIRNGDFILMASDGMMEKPPRHGDDVHISVDCKSMTEIESLFNSLSKGGTVVQALHDTFWGARFGMFIDKFGMHWMLNFDLPK